MKQIPFFDLTTTATTTTPTPPPTTTMTVPTITVDGTITSPGYPQNYDNNLDLKWLIQVPLGLVIQISFLSFDLESHSSCRYVRLLILINGENQQFAFQL